MTSDKIAEAKRLYAEAINLLKAGHLPEAVLSLEQALESSPESPDIRFKLAQTLMRVGRKGEARQLADSLLSTGTSKAAWFALAAELSDNPDKAVELLSTALKMDPNRPAWALRLSKLHYQKKDIKAAAAAIRTLPLEAYAPAWCSYIAMCFWRSGAPIEAKNAVRRALDGSQERNSTLEAMEAEISRQMADSNLSSSAGELSSEFYDKSYSGAKLYTLEAEATSYVGTWERIVRRLQKDQARSVLDIGCGPGQFAEFLKKRIPNVSYTGVDFSEVAISMARQRCPDGLFLVHDVVRGGALNVDYDAVVCTEVLEHIANDFAVFENLRVGSLFIGTVPNFDSFGHVRYFTSEQEIRDRYSGCLDQIEVDKAVVNDSAVLFIISGRIPSRGAD